MTAAELGMPLAIVMWNNDGYGEIRDGMIQRGIPEVGVTLKNPDHHMLQAEVLRGLIAVGRRPAVGFEMLGLDDANVIAAHLAAAPKDAAGLGRAVNWNQRGWPDWAMYQPIAEAALQAKLRIVATNLPLTTARKMTTDGLAALEPRVTRELGLDEPPPEDTTEALAGAIHRAHDRLAELVCSNSFRSDDDERNAVGLLHWEMRAAGGLIIAANQDAGGAYLASPAHPRLVDVSQDPDPDRGGIDQGEDGLARDEHGR